MQLLKVWPDGRAATIFRANKGSLAPAAPHVISYNRKKICALFFLLFGQAASRRQTIVSFQGACVFVFSERPAVHVLITHDALA